MLAVTERVNTSDGQRMIGWPLGPPWGLDRGGPLWWRNSVSMKEEERETEIVHKGSEGERKAPGTLRTRAALQAAGEAGALGLIVPGLSLLCVASEGLLQPQRISIWHRPASSWEQTEIRTAGRQDEGKRVKRGLGCIREVSRCWWQLIVNTDLKCAH